MGGRPARPNSIALKKNVMLNLVAMRKPILLFCLAFSALLSGQGQSLSLTASGKPGSAQGSERLSADSPKTTVLGNSFVAPKDWSIRVQGPATILAAPEGDSWVALVDVEAKDQDEAPRSGLAGLQT